MTPRDNRAWDRLDDLSENADYSVVGPRDNRIHEIDTARFPFNAVCHLGRDLAMAAGAAARRSSLTHARW